MTLIILIGIVCSISEHKTYAKDYNNIKAGLRGIDLPKKSPFPMPVKADPSSRSLIFNSVTRNSMTTLLLHTFVHSTKHSFRCQPSNLPIKKFFKSCSQLSKICQKWQILTFKVNFQCKKLISL